MTDGKLEHRHLFTLLMERSPKAPFFEIPLPDRGWLNRLVAVGMGQRGAPRVEYQVFESLEERG